MSLLIELNDVTKIYHSGGCYFEALKCVSFHLYQQEMVAIVGTSGSGKSTLMNIIGFLDHCTTGNYYFSNTDVSQLTEDELDRIRNKKIGFIFQSFCLLPRLNILQNVMLPLFYRGLDKKTAREKGLNILEKVGMLQFIHHKPNQLSGGQQQRVAIARALVGEPDVILADEPTGALDSKTGKEIMEFLIDLNELKKCTIVIVTHDKSVSEMCKRVVTLKDGCVVS